MISLYLYGSLRGGFWWVTPGARTNCGHVLTDKTFLGPAVIRALLVLGPGRYPLLVLGHQCPSHHWDGGPMVRLYLDTGRNVLYQLPYLPLVPHICVNGLGQLWLWYWLVASSVPSQYPNQCWLVVNWTPRNKLKRNSNQNTKFFINENTFEYIIGEIEAILSRGDE